MSEVLIAGVGSSHGADRLGWEVVDALQQRPLPPEVGLYHCSLPVELSSLLLLSKYAIVVDAMLGHGPVGKIHVLGADNLPQARFSSGAHGVGLSDAVGLAIALGFEPRNLSVVALDVVQPDAVWDPEWVAVLTQAVLARLTEELEKIP
ncbi:hypothetical protein [Uliginosibacterium gangwonense]|uniref:hypothetical protein n=1 Tax=Uliginosibacterium gangwonense TaxID=392736 RepID=UPI00037CA546|nr:hypothetical protein [Uliginosibacterium gangwonense]